MRTAGIHSENDMTDENVARMVESIKANEAVRGEPLFQSIPKYILPYVLQLAEGAEVLAILDELPMIFRCNGMSVAEGMTEGQVSLYAALFAMMTFRMPDIYTKDVMEYLRDAFMRRRCVSQYAFTCIHV